MTDDDYSFDDLPDPPLPGDAGETQREMQTRRAATKGPMQRAILAALRAEPGLTDYSLPRAIVAIDPSLNGEPTRHERVSGARNALTCAGLVSPMFDPNGKQNPLKRKVARGKGGLVVVSRGPWAVERRSAENGKVVALLRWYVEDDPEGVLTHARSLARA